MLNWAKNFDFDANNMGVHETRAVGGMTHVLWLLSETRSVHWVKQLVWQCDMGASCNSTWYCCSWYCGRQGVGVA